MSGMRAQTERDMLPKVGATFFRDDKGELLFQFVVDSSNIIGPRPARRSDQENHAAAWAEFAAAKGVTALDRDASGRDGGSLPLESPEVVAVETAPEPVYQTYDGYTELNILPEEPSVAEPAPAPKSKRKYTRRKKD